MSVEIRNFYYRFQSNRSRAPNITKYKTMRTSNKPKMNALPFTRENRRKKTIETNCLLEMPMNDV